MDAAEPAILVASSALASAGALAVAAPALPSGRAVADARFMADSFEAAVSLVEGVMKKLGLDPATAKVRAEAGSAAWGVQRGSAQVLLVVDHGERGNVFRVIAPVVKAPAADRQAEIYGHLLALNAKSMRNAAFGVLNDLVVVVSERPTEGLDPSEAEQILKHVGTMADHFDDELEKKFGLARP
jgi:hypothetical protein